MKKAIITAICIILGLGAIYILGSGFTNVGSAFIEDYEVSDDGTTLTVTMGVVSSIGYIRKVAIHQQEGGRLYLDCISAFGGINGSIGAKDKYTIPLDEETHMIFLHRNDNAYEPVLEKDDSGVWSRVK